jgi:hypothetical protein
MQSSNLIDISPVRNVVNNVFYSIIGSSIWILFAVLC